MYSFQAQYIPFQPLEQPAPSICTQGGAISTVPNAFLSRIPRTTPLPPRRLRSFFSSSLYKHGNINRRERLRQAVKPPSAIPHHMVKEIKQSQKSESLKGKEKDAKDKADAEMPVNRATTISMSSKGSSPAPSSKRSSGKRVKEADWTDVSDPEERRRIQNRIAQRKFREKAKENKEKAERETQNQEHAGNSYRIPTMEDFVSNNDTELSGLPWGSVNLGHVMSRGYEMEGRRSSGRGTFVEEDTYRTVYYDNGYRQDIAQTASYGSSGNDEMYMKDPGFTYSPVPQAAHTFHHELDPR